jgi:hypothetical protein
MKKNIYAGPMLDIIRLSEFPFVSGADVAKVLEENGKLWEAVLVDFSVDIQEVAEAENGDGVIQPDNEKREYNRFIQCFGSVRSECYSN